MSRGSRLASPRPTAIRRLAAWAGLLALAACGGEPAPRLVRLVDVADRAAVVESPLLVDEAAGEPATEVVWSTDFEDDALAELGWTEDVHLTMARDDAHGRVACFRGAATWRHPVLLTVEPLQRYRVSRTLRSSSAELDLKVAESSVRMRRPGVVGRAADERLRRILGKGVTTAVHRFRSTAAKGEWSRESLDLTAGIDTRTLVILFEPPADASRAAASEGCLAELEVASVEVTPRQEVALLRDAPEARDAMGLVRRGFLLPLRRLSQSRQPPYDGNYEVRDALFAPAPTRLRFPVLVPPGGRLTFSYALAKASRFGDSADFEVTVTNRGSSTTLFTGRAEIGESGEGWHWRDAEIDLDAWSGRRVELELITRSATPRGFALWGNPTIDAPRRAGDPPNVVVVGIDTLRADRLSSYGHDRETSPHLDRLAAEGVRFDMTVSASNWTAPSFASIFTGLPPARHEVVSQDFAMSERVTTLAEHLRAGGWRTHAVVYKAFLFGLGLDQGFDRWFNLPTSRRTAQVNLEKALDWLERHHDRRFFLFLHLDDPHQPFNQPPPFDERFVDPQARDALGLELPLSIRRGRVRGCSGCLEEGRPTSEFVEAAQALYDGAVAYTDDRLGALFDRLHDLGLWDDTVVAVVADHGEVIYDRRGSWGHGAVLLSDELVRVPLILKPARQRPAEGGATIETQVRTTDLLPTLLEAVGLRSEPPSVDSRSLWPLIEGAEADDRPAFMENPRRGIVGIRTADWKYVVFTRPNGPGRAELYDLRKDPGELRDVLEEHPREAAPLAEALAEFIVRTRPGPFLVAVGDGSTGDYELRLETTDQQGYLGYIGLPPIVGGRPGRHPVSAGRLLALVQVELTPPRKVRASLSRDGVAVVRRTASADAVRPWEPDALRELLAAGGPALHFIAGAPPIDFQRAPSVTTEDQLEDLRALGYIE